jgi:hypothetical protein
MQAHLGADSWKRSCQEVGRSHPRFETDFRGQSHRAATGRGESEGRAAWQKRSRERYVFATSGQLSFADQRQVIDWFRAPGEIRTPDPQVRR